MAKLTESLSTLINTPEPKAQSHGKERWMSRSEILKNGIKGLFRVD